MTPTLISRRVVVDRLALVDKLLDEIRRLPLDDRATFFGDSRNVGMAESCLRRSLEALLDVGRHLLAKGFAVGVTEYKEIANRLEEKAVLSHADATILRVLAGYRNRLVHFYHEVSSEELFEICGHQLGDVQQVCDAYRRWLREHPDRLDETL